MIRCSNEVTTKVSGQLFSVEGIFIKGEFRCATNKTGFISDT